MVHGPMQVDVHARVLSAQTGQMTWSLVKMFTSRCVLNESRLSGHGSGNYPAVQCICNSPVVHCSTYKILTFQKEMMEKLDMLQLFFFFVFSCFFPLSCSPHPPFFFSIPLKLCLCQTGRQILPPLCTLLRITFKSGAGFGRSPSALGFCAAVRIRSCDL